jgi:hypothetical protein
MDEHTGERQLKPIKELHRRTALSMVVVELENGIIFEVTPDHQFMTDAGWMEAGALQAGQVLENITGQPVTVRHTGLIPRNAVVYNFSMYDNENYFVTTEGILVHNASYF